MKKPDSAPPETTITFDRRIGLFTASDSAATPCIALGRTPAEARAILERVRRRRQEIAAQTSRKG